MSVLRSLGERACVVPLVLVVPRPRFAKLDPEKRRAILDAAMEEFASSGYERASYNRIIERAGVSKGAMYYYFDDKEDLFTTVVQQVMELAMGQFTEFPAFESATEFWNATREFIVNAWCSHVADTAVRFYCGERIICYFNWRQSRGAEKRCLACVGLSDYAQQPRI